MRCHDDRGRIERDRVVPRDDLVAEGFAQCRERAGDRRVAVHGDERRRDDRLEEDLEGAAGQARVHDRELARLLVFLGGGDAQQQRLA